MLFKEGIVRGVKSEDNTNPHTGETWVTHYFGIASPKGMGGYENEEVITDLTFTKEMVEFGKVEEFKKLTGKKVKVQVSVRAAGAKNGSGKAFLTWYIQGEPEIIK